MSQSSLSLLTGLLWLLGVAAFAGCSGAKYAAVSGTITLRNKPLADAFVVFEPVEGTPEQISNAQTDAEGHFVLVGPNGRDGCLVGKHQVRITTVPPDAMEDERSPLPKDKVPEKYQRELIRFEVLEAGTDAANFDL